MNIASVNYVKPSNETTFYLKTLNYRLASLVWKHAQVRIVASKFVIPYCHVNDAEAICEAVTRPKTRFVSIKSQEQQAVLCLHRIRQGAIKDRTARINQLRGLLAEFDIIMPVGRYPAQKSISGILEDTENVLPFLARELINDSKLQSLPLIC